MLLVFLFTLKFVVVVQRMGGKKLQGMWIFFASVTLSDICLQVPRLMVSRYHLQQEVLLPRCHLQRKHRGNDRGRDQKPDQSTQGGQSVLRRCAALREGTRGWNEQFELVLCGNVVNRCDSTSRVSKESDGLFLVC